MSLTTTFSREDCKTDYLWCKKDGLAYSYGSLSIQDETIGQTTLFYEPIAGILCQSEVVDRILIAREGKLLRVWSVLASCEKSLRSAFYDRELEVMDVFTELDFDFNLARPEEVKGLLSSGCINAYTRS